MLLAGYLYAHASTRWLRVRHQAVLHLFLLTASFLALPIVVAAQHSEPPASGIPVGWLLRVLLVTVGIPFFLVSSSGPLLQRWFARTDHPRARDPYFLSVAGNIGSIFALARISGAPRAIAETRRAKLDLDRRIRRARAADGRLLLPRVPPVERRIARTRQACGARDAGRPCRPRLAGERDCTGLRCRSCRRACCSASRHSSRPMWPRCRFSGSCRSSSTC